MPIVFWFVAALSLWGVWLNIRKRSECFLCWMVSSAVWTYADATHGLLPQALVQAIYFLMSAYGLLHWRRHEPQAARERD